MTLQCSVEGCNNKYRCKGYCHTHYHNYLKYGNPIRISRYDHIRRDHYETYKIWKGIRDRCNRKNNPKYNNYGGRGIKVCDRWCGIHGAKHFLEDMGERPGSEYSIDRIDVNGDYTPENCRWATAREQASNRRNNRDIVGVSFIKENTIKPWRASICVNYKQKYAYFETKEEAIKRRSEWELLYK